MTASEWITASVQPYPAGNAGREAAMQPGLNFKDLDLRRVLVMRLDNIGDMVLMSPALRALRQALPHAHITLLASPAGREAGMLLPWIDELIVSEALWQDPSATIGFNPEREQGLIEQISTAGFTAAFIFTRFSQSPLPAAYACYLAGIPFRMGFSQEASGGLLSYSPPPPSEELHQAERNLRLLETIGVPVENNELELEIPAGAEESADRLLGSIGIKSGMPFIVLSPGAAVRARRYDPSRFAAVLRLLSVEAGIPILVTGSPEEADDLRPVTEAAAQLPGGMTYSLVGRTTIPELAAIIRRSSLTITNNSAVLHIADALKRPIVALYSGTDMVGQWMPRSARARLLCRPVHCSPCHSTECPYAMECLDIRPDEVAIAALEMLAERIFFRVSPRKIGAQI